MKCKTMFTSLLILSLIVMAIRIVRQGQVDQLFNGWPKRIGDGTLLINKGAGTLWPLHRLRICQWYRKKAIDNVDRYRDRFGHEMFTATMIYPLVEKEIKLTDRLDKFYPQIPNASKITIEQIWRIAAAYRYGYGNSILLASIDGCNKRRDAGGHRPRATGIWARREICLQQCRLFHIG